MIEEIQVAFINQTSLNIRLRITEDERKIVWRKIDQHKNKFSRNDVELNLRMTENNQCNIDCEYFFQVTEVVNEKCDLNTQYMWLFAQCFWVNSINILKSNVNSLHDISILNCIFIYQFIYRTMHCDIFINFKCNLFQYGWKYINICI